MTLFNLCVVILMTCATWSLKIINKHLDVDDPDVSLRVDLLPVELAVRLSQPLERGLVAAAEAMVEVDQDVVHLHVLVQGELQVPAAQTRAGGSDLWCHQRETFRWRRWRTAGGAGGRAGETEANSSCWRWSTSCRTYRHLETRPSLWSLYDWFNLLDQ